MILFKRQPTGELKKAELKTFVQCPHCNEPFNVKAEPEPVFVTACKFCQRSFEVVRREVTFGEMTKKTESAGY